MTASTPLRAPFPWYGGKFLAAPLVWRAFGNVPNYVEPFAGSLAVLLARPHPGKVETANDKDGLIANFWRAQLRIALCGFVGEHEMPASWSCVAWASTSTSRTRAMERIWFSPHCLEAVQGDLFGATA